MPPRPPRMLPVLSLGEILAGLGLLFIGLKLLSANLQQAMGGRIRALLRAATGSGLAGSLVGAIAGVVTQSSNAVAVISGNLVRARLLSTREAVPVVAGGNVGTSLIVILAAINFHLAVLYLVGLVGIAFQIGLDRRTGLRDWMGVLLGIALLFLGIDFIKAAPHDIDAATLAVLTQDMVAPVALLVGVVAATLTQSSSTATILALAGLKAGFFGLEDCFFMVLGANLGSGLASFIAGSELVGVGRQLCYVQVFVKAAGTAVLFAVWIIAGWLGLGPEAHFQALGGGEPASAVSLLFLALQIAGALPVVVFRDAVEVLAARLSPPSREDTASRPRFIDPAAMDDAPGALDLSGKEIGALIGRLDGLLPDLDINPEDSAPTISLLARGAADIAATTESFVVALIRKGLRGDDLGEALAQQARLDIVRALQTTLAEFSATILAFETRPQLAFNLSESLRLLVVQLVEACAGTAEDFDVLIMLTSDRAEHLNRLRSSLADTALGSEGDAQRLLLATSLFERAHWLVHRLAIALRASRPVAPGTEL